MKAQNVRDWQHRALDLMYPIVIFDAFRVKIRDADSRMVKNKAVYIALGVTRDGEREVLGLWIADSWRGHKTVRGTVLPDSGAKFWLSVMNELRNRGLQDILIAVVDGLKPPTAYAAPLAPRSVFDPRGDHRRFPRDHGPDLHRASDPAFDELLQLEGSQGPIEPRRVCRRLIFVSYAAKASISRAA